MSVGPMVSIPASMAGTPLAQSRGSDVERTHHDSVQVERQVAGEQKAELAAGIGETDQEHETSERDADGRRLWEASAHQKPDTAPDITVSNERKSKDATGECGTQLDLCG